MHHNARTRSVLLVVVSAALIVPTAIADDWLTVTEGGGWRSDERRVTCVE